MNLSSKFQPGDALWVRCVVNSVQWKDTGVEYIVRPMGNATLVNFLVVNEEWIDGTGVVDLVQHST